MEQWQSAHSHLPALLGAAATLAALLLFGPDGMLIPALTAIVLGLLLLRRRLDVPPAPTTEEGGQAS